MIDIVETRDIDACRMLRRIVFIEEQGVSEADEVDEKDDEAIHLLVLDQGKPIGSARLLVIGSTGKIGRVCVLSDARGKGVGRKLLLAAIDRFRTIAQVDTVKLGAQTHALRFYQEMGFVAYGPVYQDAGIAHRDMSLSI
jgi:predicted GNAT family N-acyltransferase